VKSGQLIRPKHNYVTVRPKSSWAGLICKSGPNSHKI